MTAENFNKSCTLRKAVQFSIIIIQNFTRRKQTNLSYFNLRLSRWKALLFATLGVETLLWISGLVECCDVTDTSAFLASWEGFGLSPRKITRPPISRM